jgi:hypothetical protein
MRFLQGFVVALLAALISGLVAVFAGRLFEQAGTCPKWKANEE